MISVSKTSAVLLMICLAMSLVALIPPTTVYASTGDITAVRIVGSTTSVSDSASACNTSGSCTGWVLEVDFSGLSAGGTYDFGLGANNDPATAKVSCSVTSEGYNAGGNATTLQRTVYGTHDLRKVYDSGITAPYPSDQTVSGGTLTARIALSDFVYSADTSVTCNIAAGLYSDGSHASAAATSISVANDSTLAYPRVIANWSWPGWTRINPSLDGDGTNHADGSFTVRAVGYQRHAMNGKPLAAMVFTATDQHSHTISKTVNDMTIDTSIPDASKVQEYVGTFSASQVATLTPGDQITVNFKAYPWIGDSSAVMDTSDGVNSQPTPLYAPQYYLNDSQGTYGTAAAVVDAASGNDSMCVAVAESSFDSGNPPAACATIDKAVLAVKNFNNTNYSRADAAGSVYLKAGNYNWTGASNSQSATASKAWTVVTPFPGVSKSDVIINGQSGSKGLGGAKIKLENLTISITSSPASIFDSITYLWFDKDSMSANGTAPVYRVSNWYITDSSVSSGGFSTPFSTANAVPVLIRGNDMTGSVQSMTYTVLGNTNNSLGTIGFTNQTSDTSVPTSTQPILAYNKLYKMNRSSSQPVLFFESIANPLGAALVNNLFEYNNTITTAEVWIAADSTTQTPVNNVMLWNNTLTGQRINRAYNSKGSSSAIRSLWSEVGEVHEQENIKSDTFLGDGGADANRTGNWSVLYGVGRKGVVDGEITGVGAPGSFLMEFGGINSYTPTLNRSSQPLKSATNPVNFFDFVNRQSFDGTNANSGGGDYHLTAGSPALNMIPAGSAVLPYDLDGAVRRNDGTGAAGAYEYILPPDTTDPTVTSFTLPSTSSSLTVSIDSFAATDNVEVTGYLVSESSSTPSLSDPSWSSTPQTQYIFSSQGTKTLYAFARDAAGNISGNMNDSVIITLPDDPTPPPPPSHSGGGGGSSNTKPTVSSPTSLAFSNIRLIIDGETFFVVKDGKRYGVTDPGILNSWGLDFSDGIGATKEDMALPYPDTLKPGDGSLVRTEGDSTVFLIFEGQKHGFSNEQAFLSLGYSFSNVLTVTPNELDALSLGTIIESSDIPHPQGTFILSGMTIYRISNHQRWGIPDMDTFNSLTSDNGLSFVIPANQHDMDLPYGGTLEGRRVN